MHTVRHPVCLLTLGAIFFVCGSSSSSAQARLPSPPSLVDAKGRFIGYVYPVKPPLGGSMNESVGSVVIPISNNWITLGYDPQAGKFLAASVLFDGLNCTGSPYLNAGAFPNLGFYARKSAASGDVYYPVGASAAITILSYGYDDGRCENGVNPFLMPNVYKATKVTVNWVEPFRLAPPK